MKERAERSKKGVLKSDDDEEKIIIILKQQEQSKEIEIVFMFILLALKIIKITKRGE